MKPILPITNPLAKNDVANENRIKFIKMQRAIRMDAIVFAACAVCTVIALVAINY